MKLHISVPRSGDDGRDIRLIEELHALLARHPGQDSVELFLTAPEGAYRLSVPPERLATGYSDELGAELDSLLGAGRVTLQPEQL